MVIEHPPTTRASRARRNRFAWPIVVALMILAGAAGGVLLAAHH
jgi:hypothetical protein